MLKIQKNDWYQRGLVSMLYKCFDKKSLSANNEIKQNQVSAEELHKSVIKKTTKTRGYSSFGVLI